MKIKIPIIEENISQKATFNKITFRHLNSSSERRSLVQFTSFEKNEREKVPNVFKNPILIKTKLLIAEIELERKNFKSGYTYVNHALGIISIFKKIKNMDYLSKYKKEQKLINEFLSIIDNSGNKNKIEIAEKEEENSEEENEEDYDNKPKNKEFERESELEEKIYLNKKY